MFNLCKVIFESDGDYILSEKQFEWVAETIKARFEYKGSKHAQYCRSVEVERDRLELVIIKELVEYLIRYLEYFKYANRDSDIFEYMSSLKFKTVETWWTYETNKSPYR